MISSVLQTKQNGFVKKIYNFKLGDTIAEIEVASSSDEKNPKLCFLHPHDNEITSYNIAIDYIKSGKSSMMISVKNNHNRNGEFFIDEQKFVFDPNRMFSKIGAKMTLSGFGNVTDLAVKELDAFAKYIVNEIIGSRKFVFGMHNVRHDSDFGINTYAKNIDNVEDLYVSNFYHPKSLFIVTSKRFFDFFKSKKFNVVLEKASLYDGSFSVFARKNNIEYINCESEIGHESTQREMFDATIDYINRECI